MLFQVFYWDEATQTTIECKVETNDPFLRQVEIQVQNPTGPDESSTGRSSILDTVVRFVKYDLLRDRPIPQLPTAEDDAEGGEETDVAPRPIKR